MHCAPDLKQSSLDLTLARRDKFAAGHPYFKPGLAVALERTAGCGGCKRRYSKGKSPDLCCERGTDLQAAGADSARLLVSVINYMGLADKTVGRTGVSGPLSPLYG